MFPDLMWHEYNISNNYPDIRLFLVNTKGSTTPLTDLVSVGLKWSLPTPGIIYLTKEHYRVNSFEPFTMELIEFMNKKKI